MTDPVSASVTAVVLELDQDKYPALHVSLTKPPITAEYVTHDGQIVTYQGEAVFVLVEE